MFVEDGNASARMEEEEQQSSSELNGLMELSFGIVLSASHSERHRPKDSFVKSSVDNVTRLCRLSPRSFLSKEKVNGVQTIADTIFALSSKDHESS